MDPQVGPVVTVFRSRLRAAHRDADRADDAAAYSIRVGTTSDARPFAR